MSRDTVGVPDYAEPAWLADIRAQVDRKHLAEADEQTFTLGRLHDELKAAPGHVPVEFRGADVDGLEPDQFVSWRGVYADLALEPVERGEKPVTVRELIARCNSADGNVFEGYKGGDYRMDADTPVWVDNYGECHKRGIVDIRPLVRGTEIVKVLLFVRDWDTDVAS